MRWHLVHNQYRLWFQPIRAKCTHFPRCIMWDCSIQSSHLCSTHEWHFHYNFPYRYQRLYLLSCWKILSPTLGSPCYRDWSTFCPVRQEFVGCQFGAGCSADQLILLLPWGLRFPVKFTLVIPARRCIYRGALRVSAQIFSPSSFQNLGSAHLDTLRLSSPDLRLLQPWTGWRINAAILLSIAPYRHYEVSRWGFLAALSILYRWYFLSIQTRYLQLAARLI